MSILAVFLSLALLGTASVAWCNPNLGSCILVTDGGSQGPAPKTCSQCQWDCLTNTHHCNGIVFDGVDKPYSSLPAWNCGDGHWLGATGSPGLCVLYDAEGSVYDTQEQGCAECLRQCKGDAHCSKIMYNYQVYDKDATTCTPPPPSPEPSTVGGEFVLRCETTGGVGALPVPSGAEGECILYGKGGAALTKSTITCDQCQFHCLTWGTSHSDCISMSYAGSSPIPRQGLVDGLCPATAAAANAAPLTGNTYGVCVLMGGGYIKDTQMMHCFTCVEQCKTWGPGACDTMVFNTKVVSHANLDTACECNQYVLEEKTPTTPGSPLPLIDDNRVPPGTPPAKGINPNGMIEVALPKVGAGRRLVTD